MRFSLICSLRHHVSADSRLNSESPSILLYERARAHTLASSATKPAENLELNASTHQGRQLLLSSLDGAVHNSNPAYCKPSDNLNISYVTNNNSPNLNHPNTNLYTNSNLCQSATPPQTLNFAEISKDEVSPCTSSIRNFQLGHTPIFRVANGHATKITDYNKARFKGGSDSSIEDSLTVGLVTLDKHGGSVSRSLTDVSDSQSYASVNDTLDNIDDQSLVITNHLSQL